LRRRLSTKDLQLRCSERLRVVGELREPSSVSFDGLPCYLKHVPVMDLEWLARENRDVRPQYRDAGLLLRRCLALVIVDQARQRCIGAAPPVQPLAAQNTSALNSIASPRNICSSTGRTRY